MLREFGPDNSVRTEWRDGAPVFLADSLDALGAVQAPSAMTFMELRSYVRHLRERGQAVGTQLLYLHSKLSFPLMSFVLAILAISCAARWPRGGRLIGGARGLAHVPDLAVEAPRPQRLLHALGGRLQLAHARLPLQVWRQYAICHETPK